MTGYWAAYALVALLLVVGVGFVAVAMAANRLLRPRRPSAAKLSTYECGVEPVGGDWARGSVRYYLYAFMYVVFAAESVFVFPWAVVYAGLGSAALIEMGVFVAILAVALLYARRRGVLEWH